MNDDYRPMFGDPVTCWHKWFAWRPIETADRGWRWLRVVNRRRVQKRNYLTGGPSFWFQYAVDIH